MRSNTPADHDTRANAPRFWALSDLHLEHARMQFPEVSADALLLAGDVSAGFHLIDELEQIPEIKRIPVYLVMGNHEFYGRELASTLAAVKTAAAASGHITVLDNEHVDLNIRGQAVRIFGATMWTDFNLYGKDTAAEARTIAGMHMNDFRLIDVARGERGSAPAPLTPAHSAKLHEESLYALQQALHTAGDAKRVVLTHHAPSLLSSAPGYKSDLLTAAFASNLEHVTGAVDLWVHGHMHNSSDYQIGRCRIVANPRGYPLRYGQENRHFNPALVVTP